MEASQRGTGIITIDTTGNKNAVRAMIERCSCLLSSACAVIPHAQDDDMDTDEEQMREDDTTSGQRKGHGQRKDHLHIHHTQKRVLTSIGELAVLVAETFLSSKQDVVSQSQSAASSSSHRALSSWHCNTMLRAFGYGDGIAVAVVDGMLVLHMLREDYLSLGIPGAIKVGNKTYSKSVLLKLTPKQCHEYAETLRTQLIHSEVLIIVAVGNDANTSRTRRGKEECSDPNCPPPNNNKFACQEPHLLKKTSQYHSVRKDVDTPPIVSILATAKSSLSRMSSSSFVDRTKRIMPQLNGITKEDFYDIDEVVELYEWNARLLLDFSAHSDSTSLFSTSHSESLPLAQGTTSRQIGSLSGQNRGGITNISDMIMVDTNMSNSGQAQGERGGNVATLSYYEWDVLTSPHTMSASFDMMITKLSENTSDSADSWFSLTLSGFRDSPIFESGKMNNDKKTNNLSEKNKDDNNVRSNNKNSKHREKSGRINHSSGNNNLPADILGFHSTQGDPTLTVLAYRRRDETYVVSESIIKNKANDRIASTSDDNSIQFVLLRAV